MTEGMDLPAKLTAQPEEMANVITAAASKGRNVVDVRPVWQLIMVNSCLGRFFIPCIFLHP
ncbi:hypothetical protein [Leisingera methylohalidivorans]|uniref:hypothetical protein n=1 Tax=Leisingera methylohalidivorans TaxID=133924 RepID=UPI0006948A90|nr:hypothetical protein [Leisingera methylohalidivorans]